MLPQTVTQFGLDYKNMPFVNIMCSSPTRIYYKDRKYHCFITAVEGIFPITSKTALPVAKTINDMLKNDVVADMMIWHPLDWSSSKRKKLSTLAGEYTSGYTEVILTYLLLLI